MDRLLLAHFVLAVQSPAPSAAVGEHAGMAAIPVAPAALPGCVPSRPAPVRIAKSVQAATTPARPAGTRERVWAALLDSLFAGAGQPVLLIADSTLPPPRFGPGDTTGLQVFGPLVAELDPALLADFHGQNARPGAVDVACLGALGLRVPAAGLSRAERDGAGVNPDTGLYSFGSHPGSDAMVSLSQVGFSPDGTEALVHVAFNCGPRCGSTQLVLLARSGGNGWKVKRAAEGITF
jgi:hypothetical protein